MSRIGRLPVEIPAGVTVEVAEGNKVIGKADGEAWEYPCKSGDAGFG